MRQDGDNGFVYPYKALSPVSGKNKLFNSIEDVYLELIICYDELINKNISALGETLYTEHFFFCNTYELLDSKYQQRVKEYNYSKAFSCPPYPSLNETPAKTIDEFLEIEEEINYIKKINKGINNG